MAPHIRNPVKDHKESSVKNSKSLKHTRYAANGRPVVAPRKYWTSSDEMPHNKPKKLDTSVHKELQALSSAIKNNPTCASSLKSNDKFLCVKTPHLKSKSTRSKPSSHVKENLQSAREDTDPKTSKKPLSSAACNKPSPQIQKNLQSAKEGTDPKTSKKQLSSQDFSHSVNQNVGKKTSFPLSKECEPASAKAIEAKTKSHSDNEKLLSPALQKEKEHFAGNSTGNESNSSNESQYEQNGEDSNRESPFVDEETNLQGNLNFNAGDVDPTSENNILVHENILFDITTRLQNIEDQNNQILSMVRNIYEDSSVVKPNSLFAPPPGFPLKTVEEFDAFENDDDKVKALYLQLRKYGGTKLREALSFAFKASISDELSTKFTWFGEKGVTKNFSETKMASLLYQVVRKCKQFRGPDNYTEFKTEMTEVLRAAKQRHRNLFKKVNGRRNKKNKGNNQPEVHKNLFDSEEDEMQNDAQMEPENESASENSYDGDEDD